MTPPPKIEPLRSAECDQCGLFAKGAHPRVAHLCSDPTESFRRRSKGQKGT